MSVPAPAILSETLLNCVSRLSSMKVEGKEHVALLWHLMGLKMRKSWRNERINISVLDDNFSQAAPNQSTLGSLALILSLHVLLQVLGCLPLHSCFKWSIKDNVHWLNGWY